MHYNKYNTCSIPFEQLFKLTLLLPTSALIPSHQFLHLWDTWDNIENSFSRFNGTKHYNSILNVERVPDRRMEKMNLGFSSNIKKYPTQALPIIAAVITFMANLYTGGDCF
jgi:hypothetical protein